MEKVKKYYSLDSLKGYEDSQYFMIFGERGNGKSFSVARMAIDKFFEQGEEFVIVKRYEDDIKTRIASTMLCDHYEYIEEKYGMKVKFYGGKWLAYECEKSGKLAECITMGYALSISTVDKVKGSQFPRVGTIIFEEFMSMSSDYLTNEVNLFLNLVSTVVRDRINTKIYILGNAISKTSPYSDELGIKLHRMKKGEIIQRKFSDKKGFSTTITIQRCENVNVFDNADNTNKVVFNLFGDKGTGSMITSGDFETGNFHLHVNDVTFDENIKKVKKECNIKKFKCFSKGDILPIVVRYEDYYYRVYMKESNDTLIFGFREIPENKISYENTICIINNRKYFEYIDNINELSTYTSSDEMRNYLLDSFIRSFYQKNVVFMNNDNGQDIHNAMARVGIRIEG